jgi:ABC-type glycerol-3-phosphate transport system permease component
MLHALLLGPAVLWAAPVIWTLGNSVKSTADLYSVPWNLPYRPHLDNIAAAWVQGQLGQAFLNSTYVTVASVCLMLLFAVPAAHGFARLALPLPAVVGLAVLVPARYSVTSSCRSPRLALRR